MVTLKLLLETTFSYNSNIGVYAEKVEGKFSSDSLARIGERCFENSGLLDDCVYVASLEWLNNFLENYCQGEDSLRSEGIDHLIDWINYFTDDSF